MKKLIVLNKLEICIQCLTGAVFIVIYIYPDTAKHQSKSQVYISDIAPCGQI